MTEINTRTHSLGNLKLVTGTFGINKTESISYDGLLNEVLAAGGHIEDTFNKSGVRINNNPSGYSAGHTGSMTVDSVDAQLVFNKKEDLYTSEGVLLGTITAVGATSITIGGGLLADVADNTHLAKFGPKQPSITLVGEDFHVGVDTSNKKVTFTFGSAGASEVNVEMKGRFWILGTR
tara:strand:+ start:41 stop:574 length:534 start_codon:yes stop_codon:yes gene_type:complete